MSDKPAATLGPLVQKLGRWVEFDASDQEAILSLPYRPRHLERQTYVVRERETTAYSCVLLSGFAMRHKIVRSGGRQILAVHIKGDLVDLQNTFLGVADHSVQTIVQSEIAYIPADALKQLAFDRPRVGLALWFDTLVDAAVFREWIVNLGRRDAPTRVAHLLCEIAVRSQAAGLGSATRFEMPMTQEEIADCTGLTPVHVNRTLKLLQDRGLIDRRTRRTVIISNWANLAAAGDFDSAYLHLPSKALAL